MQLVNEIAEILTLADRTARRFRKQNYYAALRCMQILIGKLTTLFDQLPQVERLQQSRGMDCNKMMPILSEMMEAQEGKDYILLADLIEMQLLPFLFGLQEILVNQTDSIPEKELWERNLSRLQKRDVQLAEQLSQFMPQENGCVEQTSSGLWTLKIKDESGTYYFHANANPEVEGELFAEQYYSMDFSHYIVFGLGLGYHIKAMLDLDDGIYIDIFEPDLGIIRLAHIYMDLSWLYDNPRIRLWYDPDYTGWKNSLSRDAQPVIHYPSLRHILIPEIKLQMEKFFIQDSGMRNLKIQLANNFRDNIRHCDAYVDDLRNLFQGKNIVIVAAGPSLDQNVKLLSRKPDNTLVIAVGTVFRKLMKLGLPPDFVIFLDAQPNLYQQIDGLEAGNVPILVVSTACKKIAEGYKGKKYLICQKDYELAEAYAQKHGYQVYETGGSVSTIALDVCLRLGCREVAYIGLDLAFTGDSAHAADTSKMSVGNEEKTVLAPDVNGRKVATRRLFLMYQEWIERRAARADSAGRVIDATEGGTMKKGLRAESLSQVFDEWSISEKH